MSVTLGTLRDRVRKAADIENNDSLCSDAEINDYINKSAAELHGMLVTLYEDYKTTYTSVTIASGNSLTLPADFLKLRRVEWYSGGGVLGYIPLIRTSISEMHRFNALLPSWNATRAYVMLSGSLFILPESNATGTYRIWYAQKWSDMAADGSTMDDTQGWDEYVVLDAAIKCLLKEESDVSDLMARKMLLKDRIEGEAANRDAGQPRHVVDAWVDDTY